MELDEIIGPWREGGGGCDAFTGLVFPYLVLGGGVDGDVELYPQGRQQTQRTVAAAVHLVVSLLGPAGLLVRRRRGLAGHRWGHGGEALLQNSGCE